MPPSITAAEIVFMVEALEDRSKKSLKNMPIVPKDVLDALHEKAEAANR